MAGKTTESFENLDRWSAGAGRSGMGILKAWGVAALLAWKNAPGWLKSPELWRSNPPHWEAYRLMAEERRETTMRWRDLDKISDPMWLSNATMGISMAGNGPVVRACKALLAAHCGADFAPEPGLPTVRELLLDWSEWFDAEYNPDMDHATGVDLRLAARRVEATLAEMEARAIAETTTPSARGAAPARL